MKAILLVAVFVVSINFNAVMLCLRYELVPICLIFNKYLYACHFLDSSTFQRTLPVVSSFYNIKKKYLFTV